MSPHFSLVFAISSVFFCRDVNTDHLSTMNTNTNNNSPAPPFLIFPIILAIVQLLLYQHGSNNRLHTFVTYVQEFLHCEIEPPSHKRCRPPEGIDLGNGRKKHQQRKFNHDCAQECIWSRLSWTLSTLWWLSVSVFFKFQHLSMKALGRRLVCQTTSSMHLVASLPAGKQPVPLDTKLLIALKTLGYGVVGTAFTDYFQKSHVLLYCWGCVLQA